MQPSNLLKRMYFIQLCFQRSDESRLIIVSPFPSILRPSLDLPLLTCPESQPHLFLYRIVIKVLILVFSYQRCLQVSAKLH